MRIVLLFFTALFALPLAAQEIGAAQQLRKLMQVYRYLDGLYVDEVEMGPPLRGCSKSWTPIRPISARRI